MRDHHNPMLFRRHRPPIELIGNIRSQMLEYLRDHPGTNLRKMCEALALNRGTATYHLHYLEREGAAISLKRGRDRHLFAAGHIPREDRSKAVMLLHKCANSIARAVVAHPGASQKMLASMAEISRRAFRHRMNDLVEAGLVETKLQGRFCRYYPDSRLPALLVEVDQWQQEADTSRTLE